MNLQLLTQANELQKEIDELKEHKKELEGNIFLDCIAIRRKGYTYNIILKDDVLPIEFSVFKSLYLTYLDNKISLLEKQFNDL